MESWTIRVTERIGLTQTDPHPHSSRMGICLFNDVWLLGAYKTTLTMPDGVSKFLRDFNCDLV